MEEVIARVFEVNAEITRPSNTTAYASGQLVNDNAGASLITLDFGSLYSGQAIEIHSVTILSSNGSASSKLSACVHLFNSTTLTGQSFTDGVAFNPTYADCKAKRVCTIEDVSTSNQLGTNAYHIMQTEMTRKCRVDGKIYAAIVTNSAYNPASGEKLYLSIKGYVL